MNAWIIILAANVFLFIVETAQGGSENTRTAIRFGAQDVDLVDRGQYWRLFTSMFVHFGIFHLATNMYALYCLAPAMESFIGFFWFLLIYILSGLFGNILTYETEKKRRRNSLSAGASGAIFGLFGFNLALALIPQYSQLVSMSGILSSLGINLVYGIFNRRINMTAHVGGLIAGFILSFFLLTVLG